jgi:gamma-glutamylcyclotransferase (GGCT)/AIG2-like uncharacterized protein YtfP
MMPAASSNSHAKPVPSGGPTRYVFVYGTLRRGDDNDITRLVPVPQFISTAEICGRMYHLGPYPGVVLAPKGGGLPCAGGEGRIVGEVYAIDEELERLLDELEEVYPKANGDSGEMYIKREITVLVGHHRLVCIVYEINPNCIQGHAVITSGDWVLGRHQYSGNGPSDL